ncbi:hypothetical protein [Nonomuraea sp. NPDC050783]|uniref:hypothetical protein n=1 Tax=Nonomuraea sp. NPDC050783 TaxID=3154634 RepID=UPI003465656F
MRFTSRFTGTFLSGAAIAVLVMQGGAVAEATPEPQSCTAPPVANLDDGWGVMRGTYNLKSGPYAGGKCVTVAGVRAGRVLYFHCWTRNKYGHRWVYARVKGTRTQGWMSIDNLRDIRDTSFAACTSNADRDHT